MLSCNQGTFYVITFCQNGFLLQEPYPATFLQAKFPFHIYYCCMCAEMTKCKAFWYTELNGRKLCPLLLANLGQNLPLNSVAPICCISAEDLNTWYSQTKFCHFSYKRMEVDNRHGSWVAQGGRAGGTVWIRKEQQYSCHSGQKDAEFRSERYLFVQLLVSPSPLPCSSVMTLLCLAFL